MHFRAEAVMTPSGVPPIPKRMSAPASGQPVEIPPATSPSLIRRMRAPAVRMAAMRSSWRGRFRTTAVTSRTDLPKALATASRFSAGGRSMSMDPAATGPTATFLM